MKVVPCFLLVVFFATVVVGQTTSEDRLAGRCRL